MFQEVRRWMFRNARPVELALWQYHFEHGRPEAVAAALQCYQNEDGGFGHGLEADCWNPESMPVATWTAIKYMLAVGYVDQTQPIWQGVWQYLASDKDREDYGWRFSVPGNNDYPHAPWWSWNGDAYQEDHVNVTLPLTAFILQYGKREDALWQRAAKDAQWLVDLLMEKESFGEALEGYDFLLAAMRTHSLPIRPGTEERLKKLQNAAIGRDPAQWKNYVPRPSRFIHNENSPLYHGNENIVQAEVTYLKDTRHEGGVWPITWTWFDLMGQYGAEFFVSENWWKGLVAIENMLFLQAFDKGE